MQNPSPTSSDRSEPAASANDDYSCDAALAARADAEWRMEALLLDAEERALEQWYLLRENERMDPGCPPEVPNVAKSASGRHPKPAVEGGVPTSYCNKRGCNGMHASVGATPAALAAAMTAPDPTADLASLSPQPAQHVMKGQSESTSKPKGI
jgi:hypothetical protein